MLTPERRAELRGLAESAQPFIRHGGTDPAAAYVPAAELAALLDAADERDRLAAQVERVRELTYESDDGTRYGHDGHSPIAGYAECPGCWSDAIETVLGGGGDE